MKELIDAARSGDIENINRLVVAGAQLNVKDQKGYTPLIIATYNGQLEATKALIAAGAD